MLDKISGRTMQIDFGDCFEVAMNRDKFPEKVPFRLTRMLIKAMEVSGIEGSYRSTCERTMAVLRDNRDSLVVMLEAFVYDPLISWRLADLSGSRTSNMPSGAAGMEARPRKSAVSQGGASLGVPIELSGRSILTDPISEHPDEDGEEAEGAEGFLVPGNTTLLSSVPGRQLATDGAAVGLVTRSNKEMYSNIQSLAAGLATDSRIASITGGVSGLIAAEGSISRSRIERSMRQRELVSLLGGEDRAAAEEALNEKALKVIRRVQDKLSGTDFPDCEGAALDVPDQVQRLIVQATSTENLCQLFIGWCSFW
jgi:FKBP12-rapamycin complex-associated protein